MVQQIFPLFFLKRLYWYAGSLTQISWTVLDQTHSYYVEFISMWTFKLYNTQSCTSKIDICIAAQFSHLHMCQDLMLPFIGILHKCVFFDTEHTLTSRQPAKCTFSLPQHGVPNVNNVFSLQVVLWYLWQLTRFRPLFVHARFFVPKKEPVFFKYSQNQATICFYYYIDKSKIPRWEVKSYYNIRQYLNIKER